MMLISDKQVEKYSTEILTWNQFHNTLIRLRFNPIYFMQNYTYFKQFYQECLSRIYSLIMNLHQLYLLEQHSESFKICSAIIRINTEGKSLIMKLAPYYLNIEWTLPLCNRVVRVWFSYNSIYKSMFVIIETPPNIKSESDSVYWLC